MKTRRIHLQPGEPVEIFNSYGTSILKATAMFDHEQSVVVIYEQPDAPIVTAENRKGLFLKPTPTTDIAWSAKAPESDSEHS